MEYFKGWDFKDSKQTKELYLTHNLIAPKAGFPELMAIYDNDPIIGLKNLVKNKIKKENIPIDEDKTFDQIVDFIAPKDVKKQFKKDLIIKDPINNILYNQLKDLPYSVVRNIYLDKESLIDDKKQSDDDENKKSSKRDSLIKHLFKIQNIVQLYNEKSYNQFIRKTEFIITSIAKKKEIKEIVDRIKEMSNLTIEEVINFADQTGICVKDDSYKQFVDKNEYVFNRVKKIKFQEFQNLYFYLEGYTPFSSQHKIKGAEFENVLVVLDNGDWTKYNFEYLFCNRTDKASVLSRTQKIFYVCCTRAKENLIVFYHNPSNEIIEKAKEWFGKENVQNIN